MAKFTLSAGKPFETVTPGELKAILREWQVDVAKGLRPILIDAQGSATAGGVVDLGGATTLTGGKLGPSPAFWWAVTRLAVRVNGAAAGAFTLGIGSAHVRDVAAGANGYVSFADHELMVGNADTLTIGATGVAASATVTVTGAAIEIPQGLLWRWLAG